MDIKNDNPENSQSAAYTSDKNILDDDLHAADGTLNIFGSASAEIDRKPTNQERKGASSQSISTSDAKSKKSVSGVLSNKFFKSLLGD